MIGFKFASAVRAAALAVVTALAFAGAALADPTFPALTGRVVDDAHILPAQTQAELNQKLATLEQANGDQLVVVTVPDLQGYEISDYGYQLGRKWGIGAKGKNNGALLLIAPKERRVRIEVGYGLEPVLTDAMSSLIIQREMLPRFRAGDYPGGVTAGVDAIIKQVSDPREIAEARAKAAATETVRRPMHRASPVSGVIIAIIVIFVIGSLFRRGGGGLLPLLILSSFGGRGGRDDDWGGGGFGGGGGGGGFSGGGGSFGGGGASGGW